MFSVRKVIELVLTALEGERPRRAEEASQLAMDAQRKAARILALRRGFTELAEDLGRARRR